MKNKGYAKFEDALWEMCKWHIGLDWQNNNFARASRFFEHFFAAAARLQRARAPTPIP